MARYVSYKWYRIKKALRPYLIAAAILAAVWLAYALFPNNAFIAELADAAGITQSSEGEADGGASCVVTFVDTGRSDCAIVQSGGQTAIIDGGDIDTRDSVTSALKALRVKRIDLLFLSHPHSDHIGCMPYLVNNYPVGRVYFTNWPDEFTPDSYTYDSLLEAINRRNVPLTYAKSGEEIALGEGSFKVLYAGEGEQYNLNNHSMALRFECGGASFLFMGDAERSVESLLQKSYLNLSSDVLKVGHHGSKYASTEDFLLRVRPSYAVVTCDEEFDYEYPDDEAIARLYACGATVLRTDVYGSVRFTYKDGELTLDAERDAAA